jgi:hypothetical protein
MIWPFTRLITRSFTSRFAMPLLTHFLAQALTLFRWHILPAPAAFFGAIATLLSPMLTHLLTQLATLVRWQIVPRSLCCSTTCNT